MTNFTDDEMRAIILRVLDENAVRMAEKYGISRHPKPTSDKPAETSRELAVAEAPK
jgi:hypothetical protein